MKVGTTPKRLLKSSKQVMHRGLEICGVIDLSSAERIARNITQHLSNAPEIREHGQGTLDRLLSALGFAYGKALEVGLGWKFCWLILDDNDPYDGVNAVVSPDEAYVIYPIGAVYKDFYSKTHTTQALYDRIKVGNLPDAPPGALLELNP